jgi:hypothetical protein
MSRGPLGTAEHRPNRRHGERDGEQRGERPDPEEADDRRGDEGADEQGGVERPGVAVAEAHGERHLPGHHVGRDVPQVVHDEQGGGEQADRDGGGDREARDPLEVDVGGADGGDQPEEDEDEELAEAEVAVRLGATGVQVAGGERARAHDEQLGADGDGEGEPRDRSHTGGGQRGQLHRAHRREPGGHEAHGPDPVGVGPPLPVGVVVDVVRADLDGERHDEGGDGPPRDHVAVGDADGCGGPDEHRHHRRREGPGPGAEHPAVHGRRGKAPKSGARFSR